MFRKLDCYSVEADGSIERRDSQLPSAIRSPPIRVSIPKEGDRREAARLLRLLANELETTRAE